MDLETLKQSEGDFCLKKDGFTKNIDVLFIQTNIYKSWYTDDNTKCPPNISSPPNSGSPTISPLKCVKRNILWKLKLYFLQNLIIALCSKVKALSICVQISWNLYQLTSAYRWTKLGKTFWKCLRLMILLLFCTKIFQPLWGYFWSKTSPKSWCCLVQVSKMCVDLHEREI